CGENLSGLCRQHHRAKQQRQWSYVLDPDTAVAWWANSITGAWRTTLPAVSIGCKDPPFSTPWDKVEVGHLDDRELVNVILGKSNVGVACDADLEASDGTRTNRADTAHCVDGQAGVMPSAPATAGDCLSPGLILHGARKPIPDALDLPPF